MAATIAGINLLTPRVLPNATNSPKGHPIKTQYLTNQPWSRCIKVGVYYMQPLRAAPDQISEKVVESIKNAEEACADDPVSGECIAAWDEVEELSAAASHARDKKKDSDPLETYCKDNPETDECRTYED
ncbi:CP12 domain-containing protein [Cephalotus follicularis]|uniref:CP12 domain-containing protein n=1 Tax=Cephalotus follicularis TaxID=3775 RepID=A0A1Q3CTN7_CEPFO|nr:CP12 domain-containing protein [Cephalotus follicularis]